MPLLCTVGSVRASNPSPFIDSNATSRGTGVEHAPPQNSESSPWFPH